MLFSGRNCIRTWTPFFRVEADLKTISDNGSLVNHQFRVYKMSKPVFRPENVYFRIQKRCYKRWPNPNIYKIKEILSRVQNLFIHIENTQTER